MLGRIEALCNIAGVSGDEGRVRQHLKSAIEPYADKVWTDTMGNLYARRRGSGPRVMLCAHMDEVGMIVRGIRDDGLLSYGQVGLDPRVVVSKRVVIGKDQVPGVIGAKAIHLQTRAELERALKHTELYVDIGAKDKADAGKHVQVGDYICFDTKFERQGDALFAKALDDRVGCALLVELFKERGFAPELDVYAVFTVQEELGMRGAQAAVYQVQPELALVLEGTTANDMPKSPLPVTTLGEGPAITFMDGATIVRAPMFDALKAAAEACGVKWQLKRAATGGTDAGSIHKALAGCLTGGLSVPCRYIHSPLSVASVLDIEATYALARQFLLNHALEVLHHV